MRTYQGAKEYYDRFQETHDRDLALAAIEIFSNYLEDDPIGVYSPLAHIYKARLHCEIGQSDAGINQLRFFASTHPRRNEEMFRDLARLVVDICR